MTLAEVQPIACALARAFFADPHFSWIIRDDTTRMRRLERGFATFIRRIWLRPDQIYIQERLIGAAVWLPPDMWHISPLRQLLLLPPTVRALGGASWRLLRALTYIERTHPHQPPHWYLAAIGVAPAWQGRGFGAALLGPVLERCDSDGTAAYLEASSPRNRALYERHGFEVMDERRYASDGPPLWRMWRNPRELQAPA
jgi:ribosomal protein S18 acetylase RimI-like enzyme